MDTVFVNSENSKTPGYHRPFTQSLRYDKRSDKYVALSNLSIYYERKNMKSHEK